MLVADGVAARRTIFFVALAMVASCFCISEARSQMIEFGQDDRDDILNALEEIHSWAEEVHSALDSASEQAERIQAYMDDLERLETDPNGFTADQIADMYRRVYTDLIPGEVVPPQLKRVISGGTYIIAELVRGAAGFGLDVARNRFRQRLTVVEQPVGPREAWQAATDAGGSEAVRRTLFFEWAADQARRENEDSCYPGYNGEITSEAPSANGAQVFGGINRIDEGFRGEVYELPEGTLALPDFESLAPGGTIYTAELNVTPRAFNDGFPGVTNRFEWFAIRYSTDLSIQIDGDYQFYLSSDDGSRLLIDDVVVIDNDGTHAPTGVRGSTPLSAGNHRVVVEYFQGPAAQIALQFFWTPPGQTEVLFPKGSSAAVPMNLSNACVGLNLF